jgi:protein SCO1
MEAPVRLSDIVTKVLMKKLAVVCGVLALLVMRGEGRGAETDPGAPQEIGIVEHLGQTIPMGLELYDDSGHVVTVGSIIHKPTIITFVYFKCPGICTPLLTELSKMVDKMDMDLGKDYQILTLSFDHRETPDLAADKRENYLSAIKRPIDPAAWRFYTADSATIRAFTSSAGFYFKRDGENWIHAATLIVVSPKGEITRYIYGIQYLPFDIKMALIEASNGTVGPTIAKVLNFCYSYDPASHRYALDVTRISFVIILVLVAAFVVAFIVIPKVKHASR